MDGSQKSVSVRTASGMLRGSIMDGVTIFKGIPYGSCAAGRFMAPTPPPSWSGIRDAVSFPPQCPQVSQGGAYEKDEEIWRLFEGGGEAGPESRFDENCLALNIWAGGSRNDRLPVMVWLHGGGFSAGSGGALWTNGHRLARDGKVLVVTLNHRLNLLGFLYLAELGGLDLEDSGNAGLLDIVAALQWIKSNIAEFGGDPDNVTLFGESGGGFKISTLLAMPAARGLFHKAIVQSGSIARVLTKEQGTQMAGLVLEKLGLRVHQVDRLREIPVAQLLSAMPWVMEQVKNERFARWGFQPVVDHKWLLAQPGDERSVRISADVPCMIGTTADETRNLLGAIADLEPGGFAIDEEGLAKRLKVFLKQDDAAVEKTISTYRCALSSTSPSDIFFSVTTDHLMRWPAVQQVEDRVKFGSAAVYCYVFGWRSPTFQGKYRAGHAFDIPFVFNNLEYAPGLEANAAAAAQLATDMSRAWVEFAHKGDPNHEGFCRWNPYQMSARDTMVFDSPCKLVSGLDDERRLA